MTLCFKFQIPSLSRQSSAGATFNLQSAKSMSNEVVYYETDEPVLYDPSLFNLLITVFPFSFLSTAPPKMPLCTKSNKNDAYSRHRF